MASAALGKATAAPPAPSDGRRAATHAAAERQRCRRCGHFGAHGDGCPRCAGSAQTLADAPQPLRAGRGLPPSDLAHGIAVFARATAQVLHHRAFVGQLKLPVVANAFAFVSFAALAAAILWPAFVSWFASPWPWLDGVRTAQREHGPWRLLLASAWFLWPVWFDAIAGAATEPLAVAAEREIAGPGMRGIAPNGFGTLVDRLRLRARLLAIVLLALPVIWALALLPWLGLPLLFVVAATLAAVVLCEPAAARRGLDFATHLRDLRRNWAHALGFGIGCQLGLAVPFLNVLLLAPAAAVGAAVLHFRFDKGNGAA